MKSSTTSTERIIEVCNPECEVEQSQNAHGMLRIGMSAMVQNQKETIKKPTKTANMQFFP